MKRKLKVGSMFYIERLETCPSQAINGWRIGRIIGKIPPNQAYGFETWFRYEVIDFPNLGLPIGLIICQSQLDQKHIRLI